MSLPERTLQEVQAQAEVWVNDLVSCFCLHVAFEIDRAFYSPVCHLSEGFKHKVFSSSATGETWEPKIASLAATQKTNIQT